MTEHERDRNIEDSEGVFVRQPSQDMVCCVCLELVYNKETPSKRRFGILPNCNHCYWIECIRTRRRTRTWDGKALNTCPMCRQVSYVFVPSRYWPEEGAEKRQLIQDYMDFIGTIPCKHFYSARGFCGFGSNCFYSHESADQEMPLSYTYDSGVVRKACL